MSNRLDPELFAIVFISGVKVNHKKCRGSSSQEQLVTVCVVGLSKMIKVRIQQLLFVSRYLKFKF